jgi:hypothetical protein
MCVGAEYKCFNGHTNITDDTFLFYPGNINAKDYEEALMVEPNEYQLIRFSSQGTCLYRCGNERYLLQVIAPKYKSALFGKAGGR